MSRAALLLIAVLIAAPAEAQRICTLQITPVGQAANDLLTEAGRFTLQVSIGDRVLPAAVQGRQLSVTLGRTVPMRAAVDESKARLEGFRLDKVAGSVSLDVTAAECVASYSLAASKVWKVLVSSKPAADVTLDVTGSVAIPVPKELPLGAPLEWSDAIAFEVKPVAANPRKYDVTLRVSDFGRRACEQTRPDYFCHDPATVKQQLRDKAKKSLQLGFYSSMDELKRSRIEREIDQLVVPQIEFELRKP